MTDDEAFIRAIVDSPGDDTPRLVYADWLDDRSDPRGPYLRAELEMTGDGKLRQLAAGLDPVWVARVSRPPVGVCCDAVAFDDRGPVLSECDLSRVEATVGIEIIGDYRAFLLNYNGGRPRFVGGDDRNRYPHAENAFYAVGGPATVPLRRSLIQHATDFPRSLSFYPDVEMWDAGPSDDPWVADVVPIADSYIDFQLFFAFRGRYRGLLHFHDWTGDICRFGFVGWPPTLPQLLHKLPASGFGITDTYPIHPIQDFWRA